MNKYNIDDTVYYLSFNGIRSGTVVKIEKIKSTYNSQFFIYYTLHPNYAGTPDLSEDMLYPSKEELIESLKK